MFSTILHYPFITYFDSFPIDEKHQQHLSFSILDICILVSLLESSSDVLNVALFGMTAKQWRDNNPNLKGNIRDYASINELTVLSNLESHNSILIKEGKTKEERFEILSI